MESGDRGFRQPPSALVGRDGTVTSDTAPLKASPYGVGAGFVENRWSILSARLAGAQSGRLMLAAMIQANHDPVRIAATLIVFAMTALVQATAAFMFREVRSDPPGRQMECAQGEAGRRASPSGTQPSVSQDVDTFVANVVCTARRSPPANAPRAGRRCRTLRQGDARRASPVGMGDAGGPGADRRRTQAR